MSFGKFSYCILCWKKLVKAMRSRGVLTKKDQVEPKIRLKFIDLILIHLYVNLALKLSLIPVVNMAPGGYKVCQSIKG